MHRLALALIAGAALAFGSPLSIPEVQAKSVHKEFVESWEKRDERYLAERNALDPQVREAVQGFVAALSQEGEDMLPYLVRLRDGIDGVAYLDGRGRTIRELRQFMDDKPSAAASELWMQEHLDRLQVDATRVDALMAKASSVPEGQELQTSLNDFEQAITLAGQVRGRLDELQLIDQNLASYYQGKAEQDARRRQSRALIFGALNASVQQSMARQQTMMRTSWTARCSTYGNRTSCTGN